MTHNQVGLVKWLVRHFIATDLAGKSLQSFDTIFADKEAANKWFGSLRMGKSDVKRIEVIKVTYEHVRIWEDTK